MTAQDDHWPGGLDDMADLPPNKEAAALRRVLISYYAGLLMLVGWMIFSAWTHPQARTTYLLQALLLMLLVSLNRVSERKRHKMVVRLSRPGLPRKVAALMPLIVLALFGFSQLIEARQRESERQLARKREPWRQAVLRQRNVVELGQKRINDLLEKSKEASQALGKTWKEVKTADGKRSLYADQAAMQKFKDASDEVHRAMQLSIDEQKRLRQLEGQRPQR